MEVSENIKINLDYMKKRMSADICIDVIIRSFTVNINDKNLSAFLIYYEGTVKGNQVDEFILQAMHLMPQEDLSGDVKDIIENRLITRNQLSELTKMDDVMSQINYGGCAVFVDTVNCAFVADVKGWNDRPVDQPTTEWIIRGPQEGFNEVLRTNTGILRKLIKNENMIIEDFTVGKKSNTSCNLIYIRDIVNDKILAEIKRRLLNIDVDYLFDSGELEQLIEDFTFLPTPQILATERPDRVANNLAGGKVAILVDGSPFALVLPINALELIHTSEDGYLRYPFANLLRIMRLFAMLTALLLPGIFVAVFYYHREALPSHLLFAIVDSRKHVPFSLIGEIIILEIVFEFIREACARLPGTLGQTVGIVGGLVLGQASVDANLVSLIVIIIVALTAIGSFATPNFFLGFSFRVTKYWYIFLGALGGFLGISAGLFLHLAVLCDAQSMGIPFLAPLAPKYKGGGNFLTKPIYKREKRHAFLYPKKIRLQPDVSRGWSQDEESTISPVEDTTEVD